MRNNYFYKLLLIIVFSIFFINNSNSQDEFNFEVTEIEILNKGNLYKGLKRGTVKTNNGLNIKADNFTYNKITNIVEAEGKVKVEDVVNNYVIKSEKLNYFKKTNIFETDGYTEAKIENKYDIESENVKYSVNTKEISSEIKSIIKDNKDQIYFLDKFIFYGDTSLLKGKNVLTITNHNLPKSDKFFFLDGIFNLKDNSYTASDTKIEIHKNIFENEKNDPRIYGVSSKREGNLTTIKKGFFTTCGRREGCPPWTIKSQEIKHDKTKRQIEYKNAFLNVYDIPVFYFPKFFHPDPSVKRQSGFLNPAINSSNVLGSSITQPYFKVISESKDFTFTPSWFDQDIVSLQNEYRQANSNSNFLADFGFVNGYKNKNRSHLFVNYDQDLKLDGFSSSDLLISIEQVSNDTYLNVFDTHITKSNARPSNLNVLNNKIQLNLNHEKYNFSSGFNAYENLKTSKKSDRYQYILPYYNFDTVFGEKFIDGSLSFGSSGSNNLNNTNDLQTSITNNLKYTSKNFINKLGIKNDYNLSFKNNNLLGKKSNYKSSPQIELESLFEFNSSLPLINKSENYNNFLTPRLSLKFNPTGMKDNSSQDRSVGVGDIFSTNRLGLGNTFEEGKSLTLGLNYKKEKVKSKNNKENENDQMDEINNYFEFKLATVMRDKEERFIPNKSTLHRKNSNIFGSITNNLHNNLQIDYDFALDNDLNTFEYNSISTTFLFGNFESTFSFLEENGEMGDANVLSSSASYSIDENNFITFKTRRNRKINLTEYYDLVYEYKNDCLTAGIKYKKTYYQDRDIKPNEDLLFTITLFPLTTYEHDAEDLLN